jgi:aminopeptidase N
VRSYFAKHAWGNTELRDFLTELEATSGRDLSAWSGLWLEQAGVTLLRPELAVDDAGVITSFAVLQEVPAEHPVQRPHRLAIGGYDLSEGRLVRTVHVELDIDGARTEVPALVGVQRPALLLVNDGDLAYAKVRLDEQSLAASIEHLGKFTESLPRTLVWTAAWDATRDGETPARDFVDLVLNNIAHETDSSVVLVLLRQLSTALDLYVAPEHRSATETAAADRLLELARAADAGSDTQLQLVKSFAGRASTTEQLDAVRDLLDGHATLEGLSIDTDLRWELLTSLVTGGRAGDPDIAAQLADDATATGQRAAAAARASVPTADAKATAWASVVDQDGLPNALQAATIAGFGRVHDRSLLVPFVTPYFEGLETVWAAKTNEMAQNIVVGLYPTELADAARVDVLGATDAWLDAHPDAPSALRRLVLESRDGVRRALAAQKADLTRP